MAGTDMDNKLLQLLLSIHHQLTTDSDLEDKCTAPEKYRALVYQIECQLVKTPYAYLCERYRETEALGRRGCYQEAR